MAILHVILVTLQVISGIALIFIIATQTTKSEQGTSLGWGTIGGQATSSMKKFGLEAQLTRVTTILAISFFVLSLLSAYVGTHIHL